MTDRLGLETLAQDVDWVDAYAGTVARTQAPAGAGRLADLIEWLAAVQGTPSPTWPNRPRAVVVGGPHSDGAARTAEDGGVPLRVVETVDDPADALAAGVASADAEVDAGTDLLVVSGRDDTGAAAALTGLITGAEPVALLPRGAAAVDTRAWIEQAEELRAVRRRIAALRSAPQELLVALDNPALAQTVGLVMRAVARRTPLLLDGPLALGAALLCHDVQPRAGNWWRVADTADHPVHRRILAEFGQRPVLDLDISQSDGLAGLLAVAVLRAALAVLPGGIPHASTTAEPTS